MGNDDAGARLLQSSHEPEDHAPDAFAMGLSGLRRSRSALERPIAEFVERRIDGQACRGSFLRIAAVCWVRASALAIHVRMERTGTVGRAA